MGCLQTVNRVVAFGNGPLSLKFVVFPIAHIAVRVSESNVCVYAYV